MRPASEQSCTRAGPVEAAAARSSTEVHALAPTHLRPRAWGPHPPPLTPGHTHNPPSCHALTVRVFDGSEHLRHSRRAFTPRPSSAGEAGGVHPS
eukprot:357996-Prymnesium_polylepis.1